MNRLATVLVAAVMSVGAVEGRAQSLPGSDVGDRPHPDIACHVGLYRMPDASVVDLSPQGTTEMIDVLDTIPQANPKRFYRLITPQRPPQ